jgi:DNA-binding MarR family transcriptional regulator
MQDLERETPFCRQSARIHHGVHKILGRKLASSAMGLRQSRILVTLVERGEAGQRELYGIFNIDRAVVTKSLRMLEESGYVVRQRDARDRRRYILRPTSAGISAVPLIRAAWHEAEEALAFGFSADERESALRILARLGDNAERAIGTSSGERGK